MRQPSSKLVSLLKYIFLTLLLGTPLLTDAQDQGELSIVAADSSWGKEIIKFPIDWAPKLTLHGFEELRFAPKWKENNHEEFWTLVMSWNVESNQMIPIEELELNLEYYFDGLMKPNHWSDNFKEPEAQLSQLKGKSSHTTFKGNMSFFDGFHTGKPITINILGEQLYCKETSRSIIIFKISPTDYAHPIWKQLNSIAMKDEICDD